MLRLLTWSNFRRFGTRSNQGRETFREALRSDIEDARFTDPIEPSYMPLAASRR